MVPTRMECKDGFIFWGSARCHWNCSQNLTLHKLTHTCIVQLADFKFINYDISQHKH